MPSLAPLPGLATLVLLLLLPLGVRPAAAQQVDEPGYREIRRLENDRVRVLEMVYPPGGVAPLHTHRYPRVVYVVEGGLLELVSGQGEAVRLELAAGQTIWRPAETHAVRNPGHATVRVVEMELKEDPTD